MLQDGILAVSYIETSVGGATEAAEQMPAADAMTAHFNMSLTVNMVRREGKIQTINLTVW